MDQKFDGVAFDLFPPAVDAVFQLAAREDGSRPNQQGLQQRELPVGQLHRGATVNAGFFCGRIERHHAIGEHWRSRAAFAPQNSTHPGQQLCHLKGLGHVIVGSAVQTTQAVI
jgi:hypothetical protein